MKNITLSIEEPKNDGLVISEANAERLANLFNCTPITDLFDGSWTHLCERLRRNIETEKGSSELIGEILDKIAKHPAMKIRK